MPLKAYAIPKRVGTYTPRVRKEAVDVQERAEATAKATLYLAQLTATLRGQGLPFRKIAAMLSKEPFASQLGGITVSAPWLHELNRRYCAGEVSAADYYPKPRGRKAAYTHPKVLAGIRTFVLGAGVHACMSDVLGEVNNWIKTEGLGEEIGYDRFKGIVHRIGRGPRTGAGLGSRAGELHGSFHATVSCKHTHDIWTCDAFDAPWISKVLIPEHGVWVFVRPAIVVVEDYKSGATIGYWVSDPSRRRTEDGHIATTGFDKSDVIAALLSAAIPELATSATVGLGGYLCKQLRWDRHQVNEHLRGILQEVARELMIDGDSFFGEDEQPEITRIERADGSVEHTLIDNPKLPARRPKNRGGIEGTNRILARLCWPMSGHIDREVPAPMWNDETWKRTTGAATGAVAPQRIPVAIENVPTLEISREEFGHVVAARNDMRNRRTGYTPRVQHARYMPPRARRGDDLLAVLETKCAFVQGHGIEVHHDDMSTLFEPVIPGAGLRYELDAKVTFKVDPFYRCLFVRPEGRGTTYVLPHKDVYWSDDNAATRAARQQGAAARAASDEGKAIQRREHEARYGPDAYEHGLEQARAYQEHRRKLEAEQQNAPSGSGTSSESTADSEHAASDNASTSGGADASSILDSTGVVSASVPTELDGPVPLHLVTHTPDNRPRAGRHIAQSRASATKKAEHEARVTGRYHRAMQAPTHAPPSPVDAPAEELVAEESPAESVPAQTPVAPPTDTLPETEESSVDALLGPLPPSTEINVTINLTDTFADQYRVRSTRDD